MDRRIAD